MPKNSLILLFVISFVSLQSSAHESAPCINGQADIYPCSNTDLQHQLDIIELGGSAGDSGSDIWGWTDPQTGKEYALMTLSSGTSFVDISDPQEPVHLGNLATAAGNSIWRDVKTYANHAYIVSEASNHGMQIFDLTQLRSVNNPPVTFTETAHYNGFATAHNIVINESTGFAYGVGTNTCSGGLHMLNIQTPDSPVDAGCFSADGYTHDAQCVTYIGPDSDYTGNEICINSNEDTVTIVDVTNKGNPVQLSRSTYAGSQYTHQGWLTDDQRYFLMNDELDEQNNGHNTKTYIWDVQNLDAPQLIGSYLGSKASIDHNLYIKGRYAYLTNYSSGISIVDISDIASTNLVEVANFDSFPSHDNATFNGSWSNYPYFDSGTVIMSDFDRGLFVLNPLLCPTISTADDLSAQANGDNSIALTWTDNLGANETYKVFRSDGGCAANNFVEIADQINQSQFTDSTASGQVPIGYKISKVDASGNCESDRSACVEIQTTGSCTVAPSFSGLTSVTSSGTTACGLDLQWAAATPLCGAQVEYNIYKSTDPAFTPDQSNLTANIQASTQWHDNNVDYNQEYYYLVRAVDSSNNNPDNNNLKLSSHPQGPFDNGTWKTGAETGDTSIVNNRHVGWEINSVRAHTGSRSFWSQNQSNMCNDLLTHPISLTPGQTSTLTFWTAYDIEDRWDGGVVEVSLADNQWDAPALSPDYPGTFRDSSDACSYPENMPSFTGTNLTWQQHSMDLSSYQGQQIQLRWNYSTDGSANSEGWYIDDINISNTQTPSACSNNPELIFSSNFE